MLHTLIILTKLNTVTWRYRPSRCLPWNTLWSYVTLCSQKPTPTCRYNTVRPLLCWWPHLRQYIVAASSMVSRNFGSRLPLTRHICLNDTRESRGSLNSYKVPINYYISFMWLLYCDFYLLFCWYLIQSFPLYYFYKYYEDLLALFTKYYASINYCN